MVRWPGMGRFRGGWRIGQVCIDAVEGGRGGSGGPLVRQAFGALRGGRGQWWPIGQVGIGRARGDGGQVGIRRVRGGWPIG